MRQLRRTQAERAASLSFSQSIRAEVNARKTVITNDKTQANSDANAFLRGLNTRPNVSDTQEGEADNTQG